MTLDLDRDELADGLLGEYKTYRDPLVGLASDAFAGRIGVDAIDDHAFVLAGTGRIPAADVGLDPQVNLYR